MAIFQAAFAASLLLTVIFWFSLAVFLPCQISFFGWPAYQTDLIAPGQLLRDTWTRPLRGITNKKDLGGEWKELDKEEEVTLAQLMRKDSLERGTWRWQPECTGSSAPLDLTAESYCRNLPSTPGGRGRSM